MGIAGGALRVVVEGREVPKGGSTQQAEGADRGDLAGPRRENVRARRRRRQVGAPFLFPLLGFPPPEPLKAFLKGVVSENGKNRTLSHH